MTLADVALLVVDDNEDNRYTLTRRLKREGYRNLTIATNGREALDELDGKDFDLVLLDIMMPDMNGYEVLERMKAAPALRDLPVIMISALGEIESVIRCIELGAEDYLSKPFNPTLLRARVSASLEKKRLRDEIRRNLERLEREMNSARLLQRAMLPTGFPDCSSKHPVSIHATMEPAREVGGDLYDYFQAGDDKFCFLVGDVSGKGAPAAMFMARARSLVRLAAGLWRHWRDDNIDLSAVAEAVNRELCQDNDDRMFVTLLLGSIDMRTGQVSFINAGHPPPYRLGAKGETKPIEVKPSLPLGVRGHARYRAQTLLIEPGDALFLCTDGVFEAMNASGELFSMERLRGLLHRTCAAAPSEIVLAVKDAVDVFTAGAPKADDVTALALRWQPAETTAERPSMFRHAACSVDFRIHNEASEIGIVRDGLDNLARKYGIPARELTHLQVALDEVVSNVIKYSWNDEERHELLVRITVRSDRVDLEIIDDGMQFDPLSAPAPDSVPIQQRPRPGGLGIHMVKKLVDRLTYERVGGRNHTRFSKMCRFGTEIDGSDKMSGGSLSIDHVNLGKICVVALSGRIDSTNANELMATLRDLVASGERFILVDLGAVLYLTSAAFRALLVATDEADRNATRIALCSLAGHVRELFEMGGLLEVFAIHDSREEALEQFG